MSGGSLLTPRRGLQTGWGLTTTARAFAPVVLLVIAFQRGGPAVLAVTSAALAVLGAVTSGIVGQLGDRTHLGRLLQWVVGGAALSLGVAAIAALAGWPVPVVLALGTVACGLLATYRPLQAAILPWLVHTPRELAAANIASTGIEGAASLAGPALAGVALLATTPDRALGVGALILALAVLPIAGVRLPTAYLAQPPQPRTRGSYAAGLAVLARLVRGGGVPVLVFAQTFARGALSVLLVILVLDRLGLGDDVVGWLWAALGVGGLVGAAAGRVLLGVTRLARLFVGGVLLWGAGLVVLSLGANPWVAGLGMFIAGFGNAFEDACLFTTVARLAPRGTAAKALGAVEIVVCVGMAVGAGIAPGLSGIMEVRTAVLLTGAVLVGLALLWFGPFSAIDRRVLRSDGATDLLSDVAIFEPLPMVLVEHLATRLTRRDYDAGQVIISENEDGDSLHVIESGRARVTVSGTPRPDLGPGETFGEIALLRETQRTATVTAAETMTTYTLERDDFLTAIQGSSAPAESLAALRLARDASE